MTKLAKTPTAKTAAPNGFSLIELIVVVAILGVLAAVVVPNLIDRPGKAKIERAKLDVTTIDGALEMYKLDNSNFPSTEQGLLALVEEPSGDPEAPNWQVGGYVKGGMPTDPWGREYLYVNPGENSVVDVYTLGRDGRAGGEGEDADLGNWPTTE